VRQWVHDSTGWRTAAAFLLSPLAGGCVVTVICAAMGLTVATMLGFGMALLCIYPMAALVGAPTYFLTRRRWRPRPVPVAAFAGAISAVPAILVGLGNVRAPPPMGAPAVWIVMGAAASAVGAVTGLVFFARMTAQPKGEAGT
jgi:hypothetical protein